MQAGGTHGLAFGWSTPGCAAGRPGPGSSPVAGHGGGAGTGRSAHRPRRNVSALAFPRVGDRVVGAEDERLGEGIHDPAPRDPGELAGLILGHGDELGDPGRLDDQDRRPRRDAEDRQREGARLARPVVGAAVPGDQRSPLAPTKTNGDAAAELAGDSARGRRRTRHGRVGLDRPLAVVAAEVGRLADDPVHPRGLRRAAAGRWGPRPSP